MPTPDEWAAQGAVSTDTATAEQPVVETPTEAPAVDPAASPETQAEQIEALEAWLDEKGESKLSIPLTASIPWKQYGKEGRTSLKEIRDAHMFHRDYSRVMAESKARRAEFERERRAHELDKAALAEQRKVLEADLERYKAALADPDALQKLTADQDRLRNDPEYRKLHDDAIAHRMSEAGKLKDEELTRYDETTQIADDADAYMAETAKKYPGVDAERIRQTLADALRTGRMKISGAPGQFNARTIDGLFQAEAQRLQEVAAPYQQQLADLRKELDALKAAQQNGNVVSGLRGTTRTAPSGKKPLSSVDEPETLSERTSRWVRG